MLYLLWLLLFVTTGSTQTTDDASLYRLPNTTIPKHYQITITPYFYPNFTLDGEVIIHAVPTQANVNQFIIQIIDINITSIEVTFNGSEVPLLVGNETTYIETYDFLYINLESSLEYPLNDDEYYSIKIVYTAFVREEMFGFYRSWFKTNNEIKWMGSTHFQPTHPRKAFPCYDEPKFKATFDIILRRLPQYRSWSNMRLAYSSAITEDGRIEDHYHTTPIMSTYLIAFIIAEYENKEVLNENGELIFEVIANPQTIHQGDYAIDVGQKLLVAMENFTTMPYYDMNPNMKMTQAAIPDFRSGAMENWGLLTYREAYILFDGSDTNKLFQQRIVYILSHEIAHMWFGNLVTCHWWADLWLNEGFARFYQYYLSHWVVPEMGFDSRFISEQVQTALASDSVANAHPLTDHSMGDAVSIRAHFTTITYNKGAALLRMTEHLLGAEVFHQGLIKYLQENEYDVATPEDLFSALEETARENGVLSQYGGFEMIDYFYSWTLQPGYPILTVTVNHLTGDMTITQRRFDQTNGLSNVNSTWHIPITFTTEAIADFTNTTPSHIISDQVTVINKGDTGHGWVVFNKQATGFYRVLYDDHTWDHIAESLKINRASIHEYNRAQIIDDVFAFARAGLMNYGKALDIISFLVDETEYTPWDSAITGLNWLRRRLAANQEDLTRLHAVITDWSRNIMSNIGYHEGPGEVFMTTYHRMLLAPVLCSIGNEECINAALEQYNNFKNFGVEIAVDNRPWVYCEALRQGTVDDFYTLWNRFEDYNVYTEKIQLLHVLGCTPHQETLDFLLTRLVEENHLIRVQDYDATFLNIVQGNEDNKLKVLDWIERNLELFVNARFESLATPMGYISARLTTEDEIEKFEAFVTANEAAFGVRYEAIINGAASARTNLQWTENRLPEISEYLLQVTTSDASANSLSAAYITLFIFVFTRYLLPLEM